MEFIASVTKQAQMKITGERYAMRRCLQSMSRKFARTDRALVLLICTWHSFRKSSSRSCASCAINLSASTSSSVFLERQFTCTSPLWTFRINVSIIVFTFSSSLPESQSKANTNSLSVVCRSEVVTLELASKFWTDPRLILLLREMCNTKLCCDFDLRSAVAPSN